MKVQDNLGVLTCWSILNNEEDICYVFHDKDGDWQFLGINGADMEAAAIVTFKNILRHDSSLKELLDMPMNSVAFRENKNQPWDINAMTENSSEKN